MGHFAFAASDVKITLYVNSENLAYVGVNESSVSLLCTAFMRHKEINNKIFLNVPDVS